MRERWPRFRPEISLTHEAVAHLVRLALPGIDVVDYRSVGGGLANTNLKVDLAQAPWAVLLRLYQRDPRQAAKEARLESILRAHGVPTARFYGMIEADVTTGLTCAIMEWVSGKRLDMCGPGDEEAALGAAVGRVLAMVHHIDVGPAGFLSPDRRPFEAVTLGRDSLLAYLHRCLIDGPGQARLGATQSRALMAYVQRYGDQLDAWGGATGLVHGDCNASNFIVRDGRVVALLDWEFAFSGAPAFDFGNLLRPPLGDRPGFVDAVGEGYRAACGVLPEAWRWLAKLADLYAWADFLGRPVIAAPLVADACRMVAETIA
jgi:aminoglycoside phosphotransferase (APT) family kinase protein